MAEEGAVINQQQARLLMGRRGFPITPEPIATRMGKPIDGIDHIRDAFGNHRAAKITQPIRPGLDQQRFFDHIKDFIHHQPHAALAFSEDQHGLAARCGRFPMPGNRHHRH